MLNDQAWLTTIVPGVLGLRLAAAKERHRHDNLEETNIHLTNAGRENRMRDPTGW